MEEALLFSARLRVKAGVLGPGGVLPFVREMADVVELGPLAHHVVGMSGVGGALSTEARKRLTIACELVANPSIIFLDEPTTGEARVLARRIEGRGCWWWCGGWPLPASWWPITPGRAHHG